MMTLLHKNTNKISKLYILEVFNGKNYRYRLGTTNSVVSVVDMVQQKLLKMQKVKEQHLVLWLS